MSYCPMTVRTLVYFRPLDFCCLFWSTSRSSESSTDSHDNYSKLNRNIRPVSSVAIHHMTALFRAH